MAEIHVEPKKNNTNTNWVWIIIVLLIAAALIYYFVSNNKTNGNNEANPTNTTSYRQLPQQTTGMLCYWQLA